MPKLEGADRADERRPTCRRTPGSARRAPSPWRCSTRCTRTSATSSRRGSSPAEACQIEIDRWASRSASRINTSPPYGGITAFTLQPRRHRRRRALPDYRDEVLDELESEPRQRQVRSRAAPRWCWPSRGRGSRARARRSRADAPHQGAGARGPSPSPGGRHRRLRRAPARALDQQAQARARR